MDDEIILGEKKYISSRRAGEVFGYASDYVTQLCRSGKIDARRVGQTWFISEESLKEHAHKTVPRRPRTGSLPQKIEKTSSLGVQAAQEIIQESPGNHEASDSWESFLLNEVGSIQEYKSENAIPIKHFLSADNTPVQEVIQRPVRTFPRKPESMTLEPVEAKNSSRSLVLWGVLTLALIIFTSFLTVREEIIVYGDSKDDLNLGETSEEATIFGINLPHFFDPRD